MSRISKDSSTKKPAFRMIISELFFYIIMVLFVVGYTFYNLLVLTFKAVMFPYLLAKKMILKKDYISLPTPNKNHEDSGNKRIFFISWFKERFPKSYMRLDSMFFGKGDRAQNNRVFFFFLVPTLFAFLLMVIIPFIFGIYYSLTDFGGIGTPHYIAFENYKEIFTDPSFFYSFFRTVLYAVLNILVINIVAFSLALLATKGLKLTNIYRAGFFMPNLIGGLVLGYIFQFVYSQVMVSFGQEEVILWLSNLLDIPIFQNNLLTSGPSNALIAIIIVVTWQYSGYIMMIYIAAIQNIPQSLVEAAKIDGASAFQRLRTITLPLVAQAFTVAMFLTLVTSFKQFDTIYSMTGGGPTAMMPSWLSSFFGTSATSAVASLDLMAVNIYDTAFANRLFGLGQAKAVIFFLILLVISLIQVYVNKKREVEM
ncbi:MAG: sugar ABC transporter permease [Candidatus Izemoplasmatales bacterium]|nr:sugar ABC transporter permease [Candidatus Izemoplasmatales bacterium]